MALLEIKKSLQNYGLNENEINVYLALLRLKNATVLEISKYTKVKRTSIYLIAEKLAARGIIGQYKAKYGTHYIAMSPKVLVSGLDNTREEIEKIVPQLEAIEKKEYSEPNVKFFRGKQGYITVFDDSLEDHASEVLYLGSATVQNDVVGVDYIRNKYLKTRLARKIIFRQMMFREPFTEKLAEMASEELRKFKFLPADFIPSANILIYQDKVAYFSSKKELICILIESKDIADLEKQKFGMLWERL